MKTKKFLSLLLALAMIFSLSVSVFATGGSTSGSGSSSSNANEFNATATVTIPQISVVVPTTATLFINPMGFKVKTSDGKAAGLSDTTGTTDSQVVSSVYTIQNKSPMNLDVSVIGVVTPGTSNKGLSVSATPLVATDTKNNVFIYVNFGAPDAQGDLADQTYAAGKEADGILALTTKAPSDPVKVGSVAKATSDSAPGKIAFEFLGECTANPKTAWSDCAGDTVAVKLTFSFKPVAATSTNSAAGTGTGS